MENRIPLHTNRYNGKSEYMKQIFLYQLCLLFLLSSCNTKENGFAWKETNNRGIVVAGAREAIAATESGKVAGYVDEGTYIFKGIPYAQAERFMPPAKPAAWEGVRSSRAFGPTCPQPKRTGWYSDEQAFAFDWDDGYANEDCLRLNIWTQALNDGKKRPVMVWLHGGGYTAGSGQELPSYDGTNLCRKGDVVVVTLNHRLNVLGFLDLSAFGQKYAHSGNVGLLDLVAALQWVKNNIAAFGGDPSNVTIFGQSGGGGKVTNLLATPSANGLFHKAIVQSGSLLRTMESKYSRRIGAAVVEELGLKPTQIDELQKIPYEQLLDAGNKAVARIRAEAEKNGGNSLLFGFAPTVDGDILPAQPFEPQAPRAAKDIPMLIGSTLHEFMGSLYNPALKNCTMETARKELEKKYGARTGEFLKAFETAYPEYKPADLFDVDLNFRPGVVKQASLKAAQQGAPVYMYMFSWESPVLDGVFRSFHCMELPFVFDNIERCRAMTGGGKEAHALAEKMSAAWLNFAKTGNPNCDGLPEWEPYTIEKGATLFFDNNCRIRYNHDKELLDFVSSFSSGGI